MHIIKFMLKEKFYSNFWSEIKRQEAKILYKRKTPHRVYVYVCMLYYVTAVFK